MPLWGSWWSHGVMSSIYGTRSYIPTLQWGLVNGTIGGKHCQLYPGSLHSLSTCTRIHASVISLFCSHFHHDAILLGAACSSNIAGALQPHYYQWYVYVSCYFGTHIHTFLDCSTQLIEQNVVPTCGKSHQSSQVLVADTHIHTFLDCSTQSNKMSFQHVSIPLVNLVNLFKVSLLTCYWTAPRYTQPGCLSIFQRLGQYLVLANVQSYKYCSLHLAQCAWCYRNYVSWHQSSIWIFLFPCLAQCACHHKPHFC